LRNPERYSQITNAPAVQTYPRQPHPQALVPRYRQEYANAPQGPSPFPFELPARRVPVGPEHVPFAQLAGTDTQPAEGQSPESYLGAMIPPSLGRAPAWRRPDVVDAPTGLLPGMDPETGARNDAGVAAGGDRALQLPQTGNADASDLMRALSLARAGGMSPNAISAYPQVAQSIAATQVQHDNPNPLVTALLQLSGLTAPGRR
jgi:hypothetical protein